MQQNPSRNGPVKTDQCLTCYMQQYEHKCSGDLALEVVEDWDQQKSTAQNSERTKCNASMKLGFEINF